RPRFKLVFAGNTKPRISVVDEAIARRLNLVPFNHPPRQRDDRLKEKLEVEYPAILRWAIDGWLSTQETGWVRPPAVADATSQYLDDENVIAGWLAERCELGPLQKEALKVLFADWSDWCSENDEDPETGRKFRRRLERLPGIRFSRTKKGIEVKGVGLRP